MFFMNKKTKILAVGDIHGDIGLVKRLAKQAKKENVDLVIFAGDLTFFGQETKDLIAPFEKIKKPVLLVHGNHEDELTTEFLSQVYSNARNISGAYYLKDDVGIFGAGGGNIVYVTPDNDILKLLEKGHDKIKNFKKKIMVTHMHPKGSKIEKISKSIGVLPLEGSLSLAKAIKKFAPEILICAHVHEASGIEEKIGKTRVINVSRKARVFEI